MADYSNIALVLGRNLSLLDLKRREHRYVREVDGSSLAKDLIEDSVDIDSTAQNDMKDDLGNQLRNGEAPELAGQSATWRSLFLSAFGDMLQEEDIASADDIAEGNVDFFYQTDLADGTILLDRVGGLFGALARAMVGDGKQILENAIAFAALVAGAQNKGLLDTVGASLAGANHTLSGLVRLLCTSDDPGQITFSVSHELADALIDGTDTIDADNPLTVGKLFQDGPTGLTITVDLDAATITNDTASLFDPGTLTITNPTETTTAKGKVFVRVTRQTGDRWLVQLYADAGETVIVGADATATGVVGSETITVPLGAFGSVVVDLDKADAAVAMPAVGDSESGVIFDTQQPRLGDVFTAAVNNDEAGNFATKMARIPETRMSLPSGASESVEFNDNRAANIVLP